MCAINVTIYVFVNKNDYDKRLVRVVKLHSNPSGVGAAAHR